MWRCNHRYVHQTGESQEAGRWLQGEDGREAEDREQRMQDSRLQTHAQKGACSLLRAIIAYRTFANRKRPLRDFSVGRILIISAVFPRSSELQSPASMGFTVSETTKDGLKVFCKNIYM